MGYWKERQIQLDDLGYADIGGKFACADCLDDTDLKLFVAQHVVEKECSYCGQTADVPIAMSVDDLLAEFASAVMQAYRRVGPEDYFDGEYMTEGDSMADLLEHTIGSPFSNAGLEADIVAAFAPTEEWCEANPYNLNEGEALLAGWQSFSEQIRGVSRYLFFQDTQSLDEVPAEEILKHIHRLIDEYDLLIPFGRNQSIFRARHTWDLHTELSNASTLGPPTPEQAQGASRMSPAGIPVFYGAMDLDTAVEETLAHARAGIIKPEVKVCWGTFRTITPFTLVNLTSLPPIPEFFSAKRADREPLDFLRNFTADVARPIPSDGREHSEYAPTQVVAEYFRHVYRTPDGHQVDGILYPSSKTGDQACVLFLGADEVCNEAEWSGNDDPHRLFLKEGTYGSAVYSVRWKREPNEAG
jgi:RES domain/HEPN/RES N-terminal domain 1